MNPNPSLMPPLTINTTSEGYIRFHGRHKINWYNTDSKARYDYLYSDDELGEWVQKIREMREKMDRIFIFSITTPRPLRSPMLKCSSIS